MITPSQSRITVWVWQNTFFCVFLLEPYALSAVAVTGSAMCRVLPHFAPSFTIPRVTITGGYRSPFLVFLSHGHGVGSEIRAANYIWLRIDRKRGRKNMGRAYSERNDA